MYTKNLSEISQASPGTVLLRSTALTACFPHPISYAMLTEDLVNLVYEVCQEKKLRAAVKCVLQCASIPFVSTIAVALYMGPLGVLLGSCVLFFISFRDDNDYGNGGNNDKNSSSNNNYRNSLFQVALQVLGSPTSMLGGSSKASLALSGTT